jgi:DNA-binding NtrC family response regulator
LSNVDGSRAPTEREMRDLGFSFQVPEIEDVDIVVVDDDKGASLQLVVAHLERLGYPVRPFSRADEALESIQKQPPKILVTDIVMPDMTGIELAEAARTEDPDLGVILVTSYGDEAVADATIRLGISEFLAKPVAIHDLS